MNSGSLAMVAGVLLSLLFEYVPGFAGWYGQQDEVKKRLVMLGLLVAAAVGIYALPCMGPFDWVACTSGGAWDVVVMLVLAVTANQSAHRLTKKPAVIK